MITRLLSLVTCALAFSGCKEAPKKAVVIGRFGQDHLSEKNLHYGVKTYQFPRGHGYSEAVIYQAEKGKIMQLADHPLQKSECFDTLLTFSMLPTNGSPNWMAWCEQSGAGQTPFLQEELPDEWELINASGQSIMTLESDQVLVDTIIFRRKDSPSLNAAQDPIQTLFADSLESLKKATETAENYKVIALIIRR